MNITVINSDLSESEVSFVDPKRTTHSFICGGSEMRKVDFHLLMVRGFEDAESRSNASLEHDTDALHLSFRQVSSIPIDFTHDICRGLGCEATRQVLSNLRTLSPQMAAVIAALYVAN